MRVVGDEENGAGSQSGRSMDSIWRLESQRCPELSRFFPYVRRGGNQLHLSSAEKQFSKNSYQKLVLLSKRLDKGLGDHELAARNLHFSPRSSLP